MALPSVLGVMFRQWLKRKHPLIADRGRGISIAIVVPPKSVLQNRDEVE